MVHTLIGQDRSVEQTNGVLKDLEAVSTAGHLTATQQAVVPRYGDLADKKPVEYDGTNILFDPKLMEVGFPYVFKFLDHYMAVIKSEDSTMDFFYFENPDDEVGE